MRIPTHAFVLGVPYFHNVQTGETTWEAPHQFLVHPSVIDWMQEQDKDGHERSGRKKKKKSIPGHKSPFPSARIPQKLTWNCESAMPRRKRMERVAVLCALEEEAAHMRSLMENVHELDLIGCRRSVRAWGVSKDWRSRFHLTRKFEFAPRIWVDVCPFLPYP